MKRKFLMMSMLVGMLFLVVVLIFKFYKKQEHLEKVQIQIQDVPAFSLPDLDGNVTDIRDFASGKPLLLIYFNSTCDICKIELKALHARIKEFQEVQIILATSQEKDELVNFSKDFDFLNHHHVTVVLDENMLLFNHLGIQSVPSIYCYDETGSLIVNYKGPVKMDLLLEKLLTGKGEKL